MSAFIKELSGYSGCHIELYQNENGYFVRKRSGSVHYNARLERQIVKQASFKHPILRAPKVFATGYIGDCFYADMEYIDGKTVAAMIRDGEIKEARKAIYSVFTLFTPADTVLHNAKDVTSKLNSMYDALISFGLDEPCRHTLDKLCVHQWETHPAACHGDLTLENMLVKDGRVYLIDFLDSFHDCLEADMAKMLQDLRCMWSFRHNPLDEEKAQFLQKCASEAEQIYCKITESDIAQLRAMLQLTLLRIYPYLKDDATKAFLDTELLKML